MVYWDSTSQKHKFCETKAARKRTKTRGQQCVTWEMPCSTKSTVASWSVDLKLGDLGDLEVKKILLYIFKSSVSFHFAYFLLKSEKLPGISSTRPRSVSFSANWCSLLAWALRWSYSYTLKLVSDVGCWYQDDVKRSHFTRGDPYGEFQRDKNLLKKCGCPGESLLPYFYTLWLVKNPNWNLDNSQEVLVHQSLVAVRLFPLNCFFCQGKDCQVTTRRGGK